jgi:hypothetical protein
MGKKWCQFHFSIRKMNFYDDTLVKLRHIFLSVKSHGAQVARHDIRHPMPPLLSPPRQDFTSTQHFFAPHTAVTQAAAV